MSVDKKSARYTLLNEPSGNEPQKFLDVGIGTDGSVAFTMGIHSNSNAVEYTPSTEEIITFLKDQVDSGSLTYEQRAEWAGLLEELVNSERDAPTTEAPPTVTEISSNEDYLVQQIEASKTNWELFFKEANSVDDAQIIYHYLATTNNKLIDSGTKTSLSFVRNKDTATVYLNDPDRNIIQIKLNKDGHPEKVRVGSRGKGLAETSVGVLVDLLRKVKQVCDATLNNSTEPAVEPSGQSENTLSDGGSEDTKVGRERKQFLKINNEYFSQELEGRFYWLIDKLTSLDNSVLEKANIYIGGIVPNETANSNWQYIRIGKGNKADILNLFRSSKEPSEIGLQLITYRDSKETIFDNPSTEDIDKFADRIMWQVNYVIKTDQQVDAQDFDVALEPGGHSEPEEIAALARAKTKKIKPDTSESEDGLRKPLAGLKRDNGIDDLADLSDFDLAQKGDEPKKTDRKIVRKNVPLTHKPMAGLGAMLNGGSLVDTDPKNQDGIGSEVEEIESQKLKTGDKFVLRDEFKNNSSPEATELRDYLVDEFFGRIENDDDKLKILDLQFMLDRDEGDIVYISAISDGKQTEPVMIRSDQIELIAEKI